MAPNPSLPSPTTPLWLSMMFSQWEHFSSWDTVSHTSIMSSPLWSHITYPITAASNSCSNVHTSLRIILHCWEEWLHHKGGLVPMVLTPTYFQCPPWIEQTFKETSIHQNLVGWDKFLHSFILTKWITTQCLHLKTFPPQSWQESNGLGICVYYFPHLAQCWDSKLAIREESLMHPWAKTWLRNGREPP